MPIITTLVWLHAVRRATILPCRLSVLCLRSNWPMISPVDKFRLKPCLPVEQNAQSSAQPACDEVHSVPRSSSGMNTASTALEPTSGNHFRVPSLAVSHG